MHPCTFVDFLKASSNSFPLCLLPPHSHLAERFQVPAAAGARQQWAFGSLETLSITNRQQQLVLGWYVLLHFLDVASSPSLFLFLLMIYIGPCYQAASRTADDDTTQH